MAVSTSAVQAGSVTTAAGIHVYMQALRAHLLAVGLEELPIPNAYDASENGSAEQVPIDPSMSNQYSAWMHFAFTDDQQSAHPLVVSFSAARGAFFRSSSSGGDFSDPRYLIRVRVSQGVGDSGAALGASLTLNTTGSTATGSTTSISNISGLGDFVRYTGDSLTVFLALNGVTNGSGIRSAVQLHLERTEGGGFAALGCTAGSSSATQTIHYALGGGVFSSLSLQARAGGLLGYYDSGAAVVAPIFAQTFMGRIMPLKRVFTVPDAIAAAGSMLELDFSGEPRNYLLVGGGSVSPYESGTAWLYEWE